jgi:hypothetical protein
MEIREKEIEMEEQRQRAMKAATNIATQARCGAHALKGADNTKDLDLLKREYSPQETSSHKRFGSLLLPSPSRRQSRSRFLLSSRNWNNRLAIWLKYTRLESKTSWNAPRSKRIAATLKFLQEEMMVRVKEEGAWS